MIVGYFRWSAISGLISREQSIMAKLRVPVMTKWAWEWTGRGGLDQSVGVDCVAVRCASCNPLIKRS